MKFVSRIRIAVGICLRRFFKIPLHVVGSVDVLSLFSTWRLCSRDAEGKEEFDDVIG